MKKIASYLILFTMFSIISADVFEVLSISKAGMNVQQQKLQVIAENMANLDTAKDTEGGMYMRKKVVVMTKKQTNHPFVASVEDVGPQMKKVFDPTSPEADENGYVYVSESSMSKEMVDMSMTRRLYEANAAVFSSTKQIAQTIINLGK